MNVEQLHFDGREMLMVHDVFRREFALMPALVRGVAVVITTAHRSSPITSSV